ncbi:uncharacterized protein LTR77_008967 [Saxophila tyrrhenica]|uniref:FAM50A/XAP5 C-terminal domain-containing protein n=1 Tax=Saxophila tyrrhenica TaxID=1690608 RepID=A0AAV9P172_9PEZI|nr:hypothetical protein LTR77_008967 [Saxophila tyrrhenica]
MPETPLSSTTPPGASTPSNNNSRFAAQNASAEDVLKEQTVGLVHLSDFRKRRAEALDRVSRDVTPGTGSGASTPDGREAATAPVAFKKRKKTMKKGGLSFGDDEEEQESTQKKGDSSNPDSRAATADDSESATETTLKKRRGLRPNSSLTTAPKALTKSALLRDAARKDALRQEYLQLQEAVRSTEFCLPFVFFDGKDAPGGVCRMKKGDQIWLFLDRARKMAATAKGGARKDWARIGVDDLMLVRGELVIPHHYDFHHFILNRSVGYNNTPLFPYSPDPTPSTPQHLLPQPDTPTSATPEPTTIGISSGLTTAADRRAAAQTASTVEVPADDELEGFNDSPNLTKVVDRRWYERNKHIYPASMWEEFDEKKDYAADVRKDGLGNAFFFSR